MPREKMWVEYEDGAHLSRSAKKPGSFSPLTRDGGTNNLGHVTLDPIDGDEIFQPGPRERTELENFLREIAVEVAVAVTLKALETAKPHVERWVTETAVPAATSAVASAVPAVGSAVASAGSAAVSVGSAIGSAVASAGSAVASAVPAVGSTASSAWNRLTRKTAKPVVEVESHTAVKAAPADATLVEAEVTPLDAPHDVAAAIEAYRAGMSSAEARQRIVAALAARLFSEQQIAIVRNARIEDGGDTPELDSATLALTQKQIGESVQLILETAPTLLGDDAMADLRKILGPARAEEDGQPERRI